MITSDYIKGLQEHMTRFGSRVHGTTDTILYIEWMHLRGYLEALIELNTSDEE